MVAVVVVVVTVVVVVVAVVVVAAIVVAVVVVVVVVAAAVVVIKIALAARCEYHVLEELTAMARLSVSPCCSRNCSQGDAKSPGHVFTTVLGSGRGV